LGDCEISKLTEAANFRAKLIEDFDNLFNAMTQAALAHLFRAKGRERILKVLQETLTRLPTPRGR
jgi:hypothetical protein